MSRPGARCRVAAGPFLQAARRTRRRRVVHKVEQVIKPAAGIGRRPTMKFGLHLRYPINRTGIRPGVAVRRRVLRHYSIHPSRNRCRPSPCAGLSPARSTTAAPPHPTRSTVVRLSRTGPLDADGSGVVAGWFPCSLLLVRRRRSPTLPLTALPRVHRRVPRSLPDRRSNPAREPPDHVRVREVTVVRP